MLTEKEQKLINLVKANCHLTSEEGRADILENLGFDEWERAFEILILELIKLGKKPEGFNQDQWRKYLIDFEIDKYGHDHEILKKFDDWVK